MFFVVAQYWPFLVGALLAGIAVGWWLASPAGSRRKAARRRSGTA